VKKMSFVGSMPKFSMSKEYPHGLDVAQIKKLGNQLETAYPLIVNIFFRSLFTKEERESRRFKWLEVFRDKNEAPMKQALADYLDVLEREDLREDMAKITVPLQFINGTDDEICTLTTLNYIKKTCPKARFDLFDKCGHFPFLSKPHEFNKVLEEF